MHRTTYRTAAMTGVGARADVGPASWEVPAAAVLAWLAAAALLLPAGRGVAAVLDRRRLGVADRRRRPGRLGRRPAGRGSGRRPRRSASGGAARHPRRLRRHRRSCSSPSSAASGGAVWAGRRLLGDARPEWPPAARSSRYSAAPGCAGSPPWSGPTCPPPRRRPERLAEPHARGLAAGRLPPSPRRGAVGAVRPHHRRLRPAGLRQDPRPARPGAARRAGRGAGDPDQGRGPAAHPRRPRRRRPAGRRARPVRLGARACRSWCGTRSPAAWTRWSPSAGPRRSPPAPSPARSPAAAPTTPPGSTPPRRQGAAGLLPRRRADRRHPRGRPRVGRQPARRDRTRPRSCAAIRTPRRSGTGCCTARCTATPAPPATPSPPSSRRWRCSSRPTSAAAAFPGPAGRPPTSPALIAAGGTDLPARPRRPLRLGVPADDRGRRARPGHRPAARRRLAERAAVPAAPGLPRRAALHRAAAHPADPDGQRARPRASASSTPPRPGGSWCCSTARTRPAPCSASPTSWSSSAAARTSTSTGSSPT